MSALRLRRIEPEARPALEAMMDGYLAELQTYSERPVGPTDAASHPYLPRYWSERTRHPYFIERAGERVGFVLVRECRDGAMEMSEFFVLPAHRRSGVGSAALEALWRIHPGAWQLQVHLRNDAAAAFWPRCIAKHSGGEVEVREVQADDGRRTQYTFEIAPAE